MKLLRTVAGEMTDEVLPPNLQRMSVPVIETKGEISHPPAPPPKLEPCPPTGTLARTLARTLALTLTRRDAAAARAAYA